MRLGLDGSRSHPEQAPCEVWLAGMTFEEEAAMPKRNVVMAGVDPIMRGVTGGAGRCGVRRQGRPAVA